MYQAWHIAALPLVKKFPPLPEFLGDTQPGRAQSPEEMLAAMQAWAAVTKH